MQKRALIMNTSFTEIQPMKVLKELGYEVIATGGKKGQPGEKYADRYIQADYSNKEQILELANNLSVDAIVPCSHDFGVITAAYVAEKLGLPGHDSYESALTLHQKDNFKAFAKKYGINTPQSEYFNDEKEAIGCISSNDCVPYIIKPSDMCTGRGCSRVDNLEEAKEAIYKAFATSRKKTILIEPFIVGSQHAICTFLINGKVAAFCSNDEYSFVNPYRVEIDLFPATGIENYSVELIAQIEKMAKLLNLTNGIFETQFRVDNEGNVWIIECMRRILGNLYSVPASKYSGFSWDYWETKAKCGYDCSDFPKNIEKGGFYAYRALIPPRNGKYLRCHIEEEIERHVFDRLIIKNEGELITDHVYDNIGFLFLEFNDKESMRQSLIDSYDGIRIEIDDEVI